jgi:hypothetical protein
MKTLSLVTWGIVAAVCLGLFLLALALDVLGRMAGDEDEDPNGFGGPHAS